MKFGDILNCFNHYLMRKKRKIILFRSYRGKSFENAQNRYVLFAFEHWISTQLIFPFSKRSFLNVLASRLSFFCIHWITSCMTKINNVSSPFRFMTGCSQNICFKWMIIVVCACNGNATRGFSQRNETKNSNSHTFKILKIDVKVAPFRWWNNHWIDAIEVESNK